MSVNGPRKKSLGDGDRCLDPDCTGRMEWVTPKACSCHISPPCRHCEDNPLRCGECGCTEDEMPEATAAPSASR